MSLKNAKLRCFVLLRNVHAGISPISMSFTAFEPTQGGIRSKLPIVIMHGAMGSQDNWRKMSQSIVSSAKQRVYTVDARNHGLSPHTAEFSPHHLAVDNFQFLKNENLTKIVALGHSMGGLGMMTFALTYPELVERLIIVDISTLGVPSNAGLSDEIYDFLLNVKIPNDLTLGKARKDLHMKMQEITSNEFQINLLLKNLRKEANGEFVWSCNYASIRDNWHNFANFETSLTNFSPYMGPTLLIAGERSNFVKSENLPHMVKYFPNLTVEWLDTYHLIHIEKPQEFLQCICKFLEAPC